MGGRETARGILFQVLISCVQMFEKEWSEFYYDPDEISDVNCDKVDVFFVDTREKTHALQVKSSINKFSMCDITSWLSDLESSLKADFYELHIVGKCNDKTIASIQELNKKSQFKKVVCSEFDINAMENQIVDSIKKLLASKKIEFKENVIANKIRVLCYEILTTSVNFKIFTFKEIMNILTVSDNPNVKNFCELIKRRLSKRIDAILEFYNNSYALFNFGSEESKQSLQKSIQDIKGLDSDFEVEISKALDRIKNEDSFVEFLCREYLNQEKNSINAFIMDLNTPQNYYHQKHLKTYHIFLREQINILVCKFNEIDRNISENYNLTLSNKSAFENQDNIIIRFNNLSELKKSLQQISFTNEEPYPRVVVYLDSKYDKICERNLFSGNCIFVKKDCITENDMYEHIKSQFEAFTEQGSFSPQLHMRYVVFIGEVSDKIKSKLENFKSRSTIKYIFAEQVYSR